MDIKLRHLRYFVTVAEELHFGGAAARLVVSQPALSRQIRELERELGAALFARTSRHVRLAPAGAVLLDEARATLAQADRAIDAARRAGRGEVGRLAVRGPTGCRYLDDPRQTGYVQDGWNLTGDACAMDADGYVYFKARTDDLIISSGYNIGAPEVEAAVLAHEAVAECAVVGVPDEERGQCVKAFIVLKSGVSPSLELERDIQDHVKETIAPYKYPRRVEFRDSLPKTETGKLQRFRLREHA